MAAACKVKVFSEMLSLSKVLSYNKVSSHLLGLCPCCMLPSHILLPSSYLSPCPSLFSLILLPSSHSSLLPPPRYSSFLPPFFLPPPFPSYTHFCLNLADNDAIKDEVDSPGTDQNPSKNKCKPKGAQPEFKLQRTN